MAKAAKATTNETNETIEKAVELTQNGAKLALDGAVKTVGLTEDYVQGLYKLGYDTNVEGLRIAKNYWDTASKIRQDWVKLFAVTGEQIIDNAANFEFPYQNQITDLGKGVIENVEKTVSNLTPKKKAAAK